MARKTDKDARRLHLIEANMGCIARYGLADTTIAHVADTAAMSRGIVNFYFKSKENMMLETLKTLLAFYHDGLNSSVEGSLDPKISLIEAHYTPKLCNARRLSVWAAFIAHAASHSAYKKLFAASDIFVADLLTKRLPEGTPAHVASAIKRIIYGSWLKLLLNPDPALRETLRDETLANARALMGEKSQPVLVPKREAPKKRAVAAADSSPSLFDL